MPNSSPSYVFADRGSLRLAAGEASISAGITYEDRRKGKLEATVRIVDLPPYSQATKAAAA